MFSAFTSRAARAVALAAAGAVVVVAVPASSQATVRAADTLTAVQHVAAGNAAYTARDAAGALRHYEAALALEPRSFEALWRASRAGVDLGEFEPDAARREALFRTAADRARTAVSVQPDSPEGHFALARALGRAALAMGVRDRVKYAGVIRDEALTCLRLQSDHAGCLHVMGVWNAEVMRLSGLQRMVARNFLGGKVFGTANWAAAERYLTAAARTDPGRVIHRLDLARVYRDTGRPELARAQYQAVLDGAPSDPNDPQYKRQAAAELARLRG